MKFQIPQFIEIEDKIFGPLTLKQFIYLAGGIGATIAAVVIFGTFVGLVVAAPFIALAVALAFYRPNNRPFIYYLQAMFEYSLRSKLFLWEKRQGGGSEVEAVKTEQKATLAVPSLGENKLKNMSWNLGVKKEDGDEQTEKF